MKIFVCSTAYDLGDVRAAIVDQLKHVGHAPIYFEDPAVMARNDNRHDTCLFRVRESDAVIVVVDKRGGATYQGKIAPPEVVPGVATTVTVAEVWQAVQLKLPILFCVRRKTWDERNRYNKGKKSSKRKWKGDVDENVFALLNFLQRYEKAVLCEFGNVVELTKHMGEWADTIEGTKRFFLKKMNNVSLRTAREIDNIIEDLYRNHVGEIWLFNNDLGFLQDKWLFDTIYKGVLQDKFLDGTVTKVKFLLDDSRADALVGAKKRTPSWWSRVHANLSSLSSHAKKRIVIGRISDLASLSTKRLATQNLTFYTVNGDLSHPDSICLLRTHDQIYMARPDEGVSPDDLILICRRGDSPHIFDRSEQLLGEHFRNDSVFSQVRVTKRPQAIELK